MEAFSDEYARQFPERAPVYRGYDRAEVDRQYNNHQRFPRYKTSSWLGSLGAPRPAPNLPSSPTSRMGRRQPNGSTFFQPNPPAPIYVFLHGGYWQSLDKSDYSFIAEGMVPNGVMTVVPNFALAPPHEMDEIVRQNRSVID
jgi:arylformamidase